MGENAFDRTALGHEAVKLLDALLRHVDDQGRAQVSTVTLLEESGLTQGAMVRAKAELTRHLLLRTEPGFSATGLRGANVYTVRKSLIQNHTESIQNDADSPSGEPRPAQTQDSEPSGRHRAERKSVWSKFRRRPKSS